jgi:hypothetical protein
MNLVVTDDHPTEAVTTDNVKDLQVGSVSDVHRGVAETLEGIITITDKDEIEEIKGGKSEVSVGYSNDLKPLKGVFNNEEYEYIQTNIRANHLAIVDAGRCGSACKLTIDHNKKEKTMIVVTVDGISFNVEDDQLGQAIRNEQKAHDQEKEEMKKKAEEDEEEKKELKKEKEAADAARDAAMKSVLSDADLNVLVEKRAELLSTAKSILGDKMPECTDCEKELKTAVIDHILDLGIKDWSTKSMDYVNASYDIAVKQSEKVKKSINNLNDDLTKVTMPDGKVVTRDTAREEYKEKTLGLTKGRR